MIEINIPSEIMKVTTTPLWQWDYGQKLRITGDNLPTVCEVHFSNRTCKEAITRIANPVNNGLEVAIPDALLEQKWSIDAFIYLCGEESGQTIKHIHIPMNERKKPSNFDPIPENARTELEEMIANVNAMAEKAEEYYSQGITGDELLEMIDERVAERTSGIENDIADIKNEIDPLMDNVNNAIDEQDEKINANTDKVNKLEERVIEAEAQFKAVLDGVPLRIYPSQSSITLTQTDLNGAERTITFTVEPDDKPYTLAVKDIQATSNVAVQMVNNILAISYISTLDEQRIGKYRVYQVGYEGIYTDIEVILD